MGFVSQRRNNQNSEAKTQGTVAQKLTLDGVQYIFELENLFTYYIFMTYSKKNNVFQEISDTKWDEIKEEKARTASDGIELVKKFSREQCIEIKRISKLALVAPEFLTRKA